MMECNLDFRVGGMSSRVSSFLGFLRRLCDEDPQAVPKITRIIQRVAAPGDYANDPEKQRAVINHLNRFLADDGLAVTLHGEQPRLVPRSD